MLEFNRNSRFLNVSGLDDITMQICIQKSMVIVELGRPAEMGLREHIDNAIGFCFLGGYVLDVFLL